MNPIYIAFIVGIAVGSLSMAFVAWLALRARRRQTLRVTILDRLNDPDALRRFREAMAKMPRGCA